VFREKRDLIILRSPNTDFEIIDLNSLRLIAVRDRKICSPLRLKAQINYFRSLNDALIARVSFRRWCARVATDRAKVFRPDLVSCISVSICLLV